MASNDMKITLIGLGKMGTVLAKRLLHANFDLTVYNRTPEKMQPLTAMGAKGASNIKEAVMKADVVITCLLDDNAVLQVVSGTEGFLPFLKQGAIHIGTSTILPATSKILSQKHQDAKNVYIAANILGIPKAAEKGEATSIVAGDLEAIERCTPLFNSYSSKILHAGKLAYQANVIKISINYLLVSSIEMMGELYAFAEKNEVDINTINTVLHGIYAHPAFIQYIDKVKNRNFDEVNFALSGGFKDLRLFQQAFADARVPPDIANIITNKFIIAMAQNMADKDWSAFTEITRKQSGLN